MEQTTSLKTHIYESSLRWNIEHFLEYNSCCVSKLRSEKIQFHDTKASWFLVIWPRSENVKISLVLEDEEPSKHRLFRAEIDVDAEGHHLMTPGNRHLARAKGFYAEPEYVKTPTWILDYQPNLQTSYDNEKFIEGDLVHGLLNGGTLTVNAKVFIKVAEITNNLKDIQSHSKDHTF